jgi:hypothetical protein
MFQQQKRKTSLFLSRSPIIIIISSFRLPPYCYGCFCCCLIIFLLLKDSTQLTLFIIAAAAATTTAFKLKLIVFNFFFLELLSLSMQPKQQQQTHISLSNLFLGVKVLQVVSFSLSRKKNIEKNNTNQFSFCCICSRLTIIQLHG